MFSKQEKCEFFRFGPLDGDPDRVHWRRK